MVTLVVGFPGSGKSYYAVNQIYELLKNQDKSKNIDVIYTNINGIKFDYFPNSSIEFKKFNSEEFYIYLAQCYSIYQLNKNSDSVDDELVKYSKEMNYHKALIVFDECHDFFTPQDKIKIFWLTYHRHLFHEIILLTQNKALIHSKYRAIPEIFVEAQPRSKKLFSNTLTYKKFASFAMKQTDFFGKESLKTKDEVFKLYQSGNKSSQKSILHKYILIGVIAFALVVAVFYNIVGSYIQDVEPTTTSDTTQSTNKNIHNVSRYKENHKTQQNQISDTFVISFLCDNKNGCIFYDNSYPLSYIHKFINQTDSKKLYTDILYLDDTIHYKLYKIYVNSSKKNLQNFFIDTNNNFTTNTKRSIESKTFSSPLEKVKL